MGQSAADYAKPAPRRYFILGTGRNGSSLFSAILAASGANFGMTHTGTWDPRTGAYEHPALGRGAACYRLSERLRDASHVSRWVMWRRKWLRAKAKIHLRRALHEAEYLKTGDARVPMLARQLGFTPCILLLFRNYREQFASAYLRHGSSVSELRHYYFDVNQSALLALSIYGGTVVHYADIVDHTRTEWARTVGEVTGLPADRLLEKRVQLVKPWTPTGTSPLIEDTDLDALDAQLRSLCGRIFAASRLAERT